MTAGELAAQLEAIRQELTRLESEQAALAAQAKALRQRRNELLCRFAAERKR